MFRTTVPCLALCWGVGCSEWPRFAHRSTEGSSPFDQITVTGQLLEPEEDWPDAPNSLQLPSESFDFGEPLVAVDIHGTADPVSHLVDGTTPFTECPNIVDAPPVPGRYVGDVDFVRFSYADAANAEEYGLCLVLQTSPPQPGATWDLVAYEYSEAEACTTGDYLTNAAAETGGGYAAVTEVGGHNYIEAGHSDLALYIAGSVDTTSYTDGGSVAITYDVFVYPVRNPVGCETLLPEFFQPGAR